LGRVSQFQGTVTLCWLLKSSEFGAILWLFSLLRVTIANVLGRKGWVFVTVSLYP
jgi:hypothetical protein